MSSLIDEINGLLANNLNDRILIFGSAEIAPSHHLVRTDFKAFLDENVHNDFDLALVMELEKLSKSQGIELLAKLRNCYGCKIIVGMEKPNQWSLEDFIGLGFKRERRQLEWEIYSYDIGTYNRKRQWNNSKFWANPEMWHRRF